MQIEKLKMGDKALQFDVSGPELAYLYENAIAFVYPSLYEGFGMPILEAYANACPVALSRIDVFKEIARDAAIYFDPHNVESIHEAISRLMHSNDTRNALRERGRQRLKNFSWEITASKTVDTYKKAINEIRSV